MHRDRLGRRGSAGKTSNRTSEKGRARQGEKERGTKTGGESRKQHDETRDEAAAAKSSESCHDRRHATHI
eukprot:scaffold307_cov134-Pinguiococcus_pyrenoidosus.AAC.1